MSEKILTKEPLAGAPSKDSAGRTITAERVERAEANEPAAASVVLQVPGIRVEASDDDGAGLARALATLAAMVPG